jgi:DNA polymerase
LLPIVRTFQAWLSGAPDPDNTARQPAAAPPSDSGTLPILQAQAATCTACPLAAGRTRSVFADGNPHARLMLIGEAPGLEDEAQGLPFVGEAGQLLDKMLAAIGFDRSGFHVTNTVKCRPPDDRPPLPAETAACRLFLDRQIEAVAPLLIVTLGDVATRTLLACGEGIADLRGRQFTYRGIPLIPLYHPAYLLRSPEKKREAWQDLQFIRKAYDGLAATLS